MKSKIYIINGSAESGKNTIYEIFTKYYKKKLNYSIYNISTVDPIKSFLSKYYNLEEYEQKKSNSTKYRNLISNIKNLLDEFDDLTNKQVYDKIKNGCWNEENIFFIHCREIENIKKLKSMLSEFDVKTIYVRRKEHNVSECEKDDLNIIEKFQYDYYFENDGLSDFENDVISFIKNNH